MLTAVGRIRATSFDFGKIAKLFVETVERVKVLNGKKLHKSKKTAIKMDIFDLAIEKILKDIFIKSSYYHKFTTDHQKIHKILRCLIRQWLLRSLEICPKISLQLTGARPTNLDLFVIERYNKILGVNNVACVRKNELVNLALSVRKSAVFMSVDTKIKFVAFINQSWIDYEDMHRHDKNVAGKIDDMCSVCYNHASTQIDKDSNFLSVCGGSKLCMNMMCDRCLLAQTACKKCKKIFCVECETICNCCGGVDFCSDHVMICKMDIHYVCADCWKKHCYACNEILCENCMEEGEYGGYCIQCTNEFCNDDLFTCNGCEDTVCSYCSKKCERCSHTFCPDDECIVSCDVCHNYLCKHCFDVHEAEVCRGTGGDCDTYVCSMFCDRCNVCDDMFCSKCVEECGLHGCATSMCEGCTKRCSKCSFRGCSLICLNRHVCSNRKRNAEDLSNMVEDVTGLKKSK